MSDIPQEVIDEILSRLPVKSLLRFKCVSKSFKSLIDSPKFIQAHLKQQSLKPNSDGKLLILNKNQKKLFSLDDFNSSILNTQQQPQELEHPFEQPHDEIQVLGSCNGLVFLSNNVCENGIWNLSTKVYVKLDRFCRISLPRVPPKGEGKYMFFDQICGGFGYDSSHDDYKVVRIVQCVFSYGNLLSETMIYSLKMGVWKDGEDCPYWLVKEDFGTYAAGALYWLGFKESHGELILVSLDLGSERFEQVLYPENLGKPCRLNLAALGDCLCLLAASGHVVTRMDVKNHVDVWVLKAYGVEQSWVKLFTVEQLEGRQHFSYMRSIAYSMTGGEVLLEMDNRKFLWYNHEKKSLKRAKIGGGLNSFESFVNFGTLVPLYGRGNEKDSKKGAEEGDGSVTDEL